MKSPRSSSCFHPRSPNSTARRVSHHLLHHRLGHFDHLLHLMHLRMFDDALLHLDINLRHVAHLSPWPWRRRSPHVVGVFLFVRGAISWISIFGTWRSTVWITVWGTSTIFSSSRLQRGTLFDESPSCAFDLKPCGCDPPVPQCYNKPLTILSGFLPVLTGLTTLPLSHVPCFAALCTLFGQQQQRLRTVRTRYKRAKASANMRCVVSESDRRCISFEGRTRRKVQNTTGTRHAGNTLHEQLCSGLSLITLQL